MKKILSLVILAVAALSHPTFSQKPGEKSLLWEISGNGLTSPSYVFGSIHFCDTNEFKLPERIFHLLSACEHVAFELDVTDPDILRQLNVSLAMKGEPGRSLMSDLDNTYRTKLERIFQAEQENPIMAMMKMQVNTVNPYYLVNIILVADQMRSRSGNYAMDPELIMYAKSKNKKIVSLETPEEQLQCISGSHLSWGEKMYELKKAIDNYLIDSLKSDRMFLAYINQDIEELIGPVSDSFFEQRNRNMVERLVPVLQRGATFVVVGAAHLPFEYGVLQLLRDKGFTVKPATLNLIVKRSPDLLPKEQGK